MEKKYLLGYVYGKEAVMWDDVKDFTETIDEETGLKTIKFKENDVEYVYTGNDIRGYREQNNKSPFITSYKLMGRRTALRHDYLNDNKRMEARPFEPEENDDDEDFNFEEPEEEFEDDDDDEDMFGLRRFYSRGYSSSCGVRGNYCGSSHYYGGCGSSGC